MFVMLVLALLTTCGLPVREPVLELKSVLPLYCAVIVWLPTASADVVHVATPAARATLAQPATEPAPSRKLTVPVGVPAPGATAATVAVNVTLSPNTDGFCDDVRAVVV